MCISPRQDKQAAPLLLPSHPSCPPAPPCFFIPISRSFPPRASLFSPLPARPFAPRRPGEHTGLLLLGRRGGRPRFGMCTPKLEGWGCGDVMLSLPEPPANLPQCSLAKPAEQNRRIWSKDVQPQLPYSSVASQGPRGLCVVSKAKKSGVLRLKSGGSIGEKGLVPDVEAEAAETRPAAAARLGRGNLAQPYGASLLGNTSGRWS